MALEGGLTYFFLTFSKSEKKNGAEGGLGRVSDFF